MEAILIHVHDEDGQGFVFFVFFFKWWNNDLFLNKLIIIWINTNILIIFLQRLY